LVALAAVAGLLIFTGVRPMVALLCCGGMAILFIGPMLVLKVRHGRLAEVVLTLDEDVLRVTRRSGQAVDVKEMGRSEAGLLIRWASDSLEKRSRRLQLEDASGRVRVELVERDVVVRTVPFGINLESYGIDARHAPLDVLIGSWWPDPGRRVARVNKPRLSLRAVRDRSWGRPDLGGYALWKARGQAMEGLFIVGAGLAPLCLIAFVLASSRTTGGWWGVALTVATCVGFISYGVWRVWRSRRGLRQLVADLTSLRFGGILNRNG
jgi:hypothetical protein